MRRRSPACAAGAIAGLLVITGCSSSSGRAQDSGASAGSSSAASSPSAGLAVGSAMVPSSSAAALGDLRTLDPCSLVPSVGSDPAGQAAFGDPQSMDYCTVVVTTAAGDVELHVGELVDRAPADAGPPRGTTPMTGGAQAVQGAQAATSCTDRLDFTDHVSLIAQALPPYGSSTVGSCVVADLGLSGAITAIAGGKVAHRTYPARSFGPVDPCTVLTNAVVRATLPALASTRAVANPARHQCRFGTSTATTTYAALVLGAAYQRFDGGPTSTTITVHGHQVVMVPTQPSGRPTDCTGYGPHISYPSKSGQPAMEMAELHVSLPDGAPAAQACQDVAALARTVFTKLP